MNAATMAGMTPLLFAAQRGMENTALHLIERGASIRAKTTKGETVRFFAARNKLDRLSAAVEKLRENESATEVPTDAQTEL